MPNIVATDPDNGQTYSIPNTPESIKDATDKGYQVDSGGIDLSSIKSQLGAPGAPKPESTVATGDQFRQAQEAKQNIHSDVSDIDLTNEGKARAIDPDSGEEYHIPASVESVNDAKVKGYRLVSDLQEEAKSAKIDEQKVADYQSKLSSQYAAGSTFLGELKEGVGGLFSNRPTGTGLLTPEEDKKYALDPAWQAVPNKYFQILKDNKVPTEDLPYALQALQNIEQKHPQAQFLGEAADFVAGLGAVPKAAGAFESAAIRAVGLGEKGGILSSIGRTIVRAGVDTAVLNGPEEVANGIKNYDPNHPLESIEQTGENLVKDGLLNTGLHVVGGTVGAGMDYLSKLRGGSLSELAAPVIASATGMDADRVEANILRNLGASDASINDLTVAEGNKGLTKAQAIEHIDDYLGDLSKDSRGKVGRKILDMGKESGEEIGSLTDKLDELSKPGSKVELPEAMRTESQRGFGQFGEPLDVYDLDNYNNRVEAKKLTDFVDKRIDEVVGADKESFLRNTKQLIDKVTDENGRIAPTDMKELNTKINELIPADQLNTLVGEKKLVSTFINAEKEMSNNAIAAASGSHDLLAQLQSANIKYKIFRLLEEGKDLINNRTAEKFAPVGARGVGRLSLLLVPVRKAVTNYWDQLGEYRLNRAVYRQIKAGQAVDHLVIDGAIKQHKFLQSLPAILSAGRHPVQEKKNFDGLKTLLGEEANGLTKAQQYQRVVEKLNDPHIMDRQLQISGSVGDGRLAQIVQQKMQMMHQVLQKAITPLNPKQPFTDPAKMTPTQKQINDLNDVVRLVNNPEALLHDYQDGTLTPSKVNVVKSLFPASYARMQQSIWLQRNNINASLQDRIYMSILMGRDMNIGATLPDMSGGAAGGSAPSSGASGAPRSGNRKGSKEGPASFETDADRVRAGKSKR